MAGPDAGGTVGRHLAGRRGGGRWLCLRALAPVSRMARAATAMTAADLGQRLPAPGTGDELDELGRAFNDLLDRLNEAFVRLNEAYDRQRRFAGDASHQLRTPDRGAARSSSGRAAARPLARGIQAVSRSRPERGRTATADHRIAPAAGTARRHAARAHGRGPGGLGARPSRALGRRTRGLRTYGPRSPENGPLSRASAPRAARPARR